MVPPAQSLSPQPERPPAQVAPPPNSAPDAPPQPAWNNPAAVPNATDQQREPSGNAPPARPERPPVRAAAAPNTPNQMAPDRATIPPAQPVRPVPPSDAAAAERDGVGEERQQPQEDRERTASTQYVLLSALMNRPIIDLGNGRRVGSVESIVLDSHHQSVEAYATRGGFLRGTKAFPARGAHIGEDAITLPPGALDRFDMRSLRGLPIAHSVVGTRLLSEAGRVLGTIKDIRMDPRTADVLGYEVNPEDRSLLDRFTHRTALLPVDAVQRRGTDAWIVGEDNARRYFGG